MIGSPVNEGIAGDKKSYYEYEEVFNMKKLISMSISTLRKQQRVYLKQELARVQTMPKKISLMEICL
jgi:hypothetical protein